MGSVQIVTSSLLNDVLKFTLKINLFSLRDLVARSGVSGPRKIMEVISIRQMQFGHLCNDGGDFW